MSDTPFDEIFGTLKGNYERRDPDMMAKRIDVLEARAKASRESMIKVNELLKEMIRRIQQLEQRNG